jgi:predicted lipoprotein
MIAIENVDNKSVYKIEAKISSEDMKTEYKTITKEITFDEFNLQVKYTQEELDLKSRVEEIVKKALFTTAASILNNEVVGEVAIIESGLGDKMQSGLNIECAKLNE